MIREVQKGDAGAVAEIYNHFVENTVVTFEEEAVSVDEMAQRIETIGGEFPWLVFEEEGKILGFAYAKTWQVKSAYRFSLESTVYLAPGQAGKGIGTGLYEQLLPELKSRGVHVVIAGITLPNPHSIALHEKFGFTKAAHYKEVGRKFGEWIDVGYWQLLL